MHDTSRSVGASRPIMLGLMGLFENHTQAVNLRHELHIERPRDVEGLAPELAQLDRLQERFQP